MRSKVSESANINKYIVYESEKFDKISFGNVQQI